MTTTYFNITQVHRITGKSPTTIRKHIKQRKLSFDRDANGNRVIEASEITRVYGVGVDDFKRASPTSKTSSAEQNGDQASSQLAGSVQARLDTEIEERKAERKRYERQIEDLHGVLKRTQEGHERAMRLIEGRSVQAGDWQKPFKALQQQVANNEIEQRRLRAAAKKKIDELKEELEAEKSKSIFAKLFG